jgi:hypothetical protein
VSDSRDQRRVVSFDSITMIAKKVRVHFGCDGTVIWLSAACRRTGRYDFTVQPLSFAVGNHGATYSFESALTTASVTYDDAGLYLSSSHACQSSSSKDSGITYWG